MRYRSAVEGMTKHGNALDAALCVMELAQFLLVQGRAAEIESLCLAAAARVDAAGLTEKSRDVWQVFLATARAESLQLRELITLVELVRTLRRKPEADVPQPS